MRTVNISQRSVQRRFSIEMTANISGPTGLTHHRNPALPFQPSAYYLQA